MRIRVHLVSLGLIAFLSAAVAASAAGPTFRIAALEYSGRTDFIDSDEKMQVLYDGLDIALTAQERAGTPIDLIVTAEAPTMMGYQYDFDHMAQAIPGPRSGRLGAIAAAHHVWLVSGLREADKETGQTKLYSSAVVLDRSGRLVGKYRKVNIPDVEVELGIQAGTESLVVDTEFGPMGLMICLDATVPEYVADLMSKKPHFVVVPSEGDFPYDLWNSAGKYGVYIASAIWAGPSRIYDAEGDSLAEQEYEGAIPSEMKLVVAEIPRGGASGFAAGDVNHSGGVDMVDLLFLVDAWESRAGAANYNAACDLDGDAAVTIYDLLILVNHWSQ